MIGCDFLAAQAIGELPLAFISCSTNAATTLTNDPDAKIKLVMEATPHSLFSEIGFPYQPSETMVGGLLSADETPNNTVYLADDLIDSPSVKIQQGLVVAMNYAASIPRPLGTGGNSSFGTAVIANDDGTFDNLCGQSWEGRDIRFWFGGTLNQGLSTEHEMLWKEYSPLVDLKAASISWNQSTIEVLFKDRTLLLDNAMTVASYGGTGAADGDATAKGKVKPRAYGTLTGVTPVRIDETNHVYQLHDGAIVSVSDVFDGETAIGTKTAVADVFAWTPVSNHVAIDIANGLIRLGGAPTDAITVDFVGKDLTHTTSGDSNIWNISREMAIEAGFKYPDDFRLETLSDFDGGIFLDSVVNYRAAIEELLSGVGYFATQITGKLEFNEWKNPKTEIPEYELHHGNPDDTFVFSDIEDLKRIATAEPISQVTVFYKKRYTVQSEFEGRDIEYQSATKSNSYAASQFPSARKIEVKTALSTEANAEALANLIIDRDRYRKSLYNFSATRKMFQIEIGSIGLLKSDRFGLSTGKPFQILKTAVDSRLGIVTGELLLTDG